jgi:DNA-directed RNA polymerase subunit H (RpoH/RPB5)
MHLRVLKIEVLLRKEKQLPRMQLDDVIANQLNLSTSDSLVQDANDKEKC